MSRFDLSPRFDEFYAPWCGWERELEMRKNAWDAVVAGLKQGMKEEEEVKNYEHKVDCDGNLIVWLKRDKQCEKGGRSFFVVRKDGHSMEVYDHQSLYYSGRKLRDIAWAAFGKPKSRIKELLRVDQYLSVITQSEDRYIGQVGRIEDTRFLLVYKQSSLSDVGQWIYYHDVCDILDAGLGEVIYPTGKGNF